MSSKILFVPQHMASLNEMILLSKVLRKGSAIFYISFPVSEGVLIKIKSNGSEVVIDGGLESSKSLFTSFKMKIRKFLLSSPIVNFFINGYLTDFLANKLFIKVENKADFLDKLISKHNIRKFILSTDRSVGVELSIAVLAMNKPIELIVVSFAVSADISSSEKLRKSSLYYNEKRDSWNTAILPNGKRISFFKPFEKKVIELLGIKIENPWVLGAGFSDYMLVDSEREKERLVRMGGKSEKYLVTGQISHDYLFKANNDIDVAKKFIFNRYGLLNSKVILLAVPQYYEHGLCGIDKHFYLINEMIEMLASLEVNLLLSLHPKMNKSDYDKLVFGKHNVHIVEEALSEVLPICDIFLSTFSSTVSWALLSRKKIVIVDHVSLGYTDFFSEFRIPIINDNCRLLELVKFELNSKDSVVYNDELIAKLSPFDGKCSDRIASLLN